MSPRGQYERPDRSKSPHKKRIPIGTRDKLNFEQREGFVRRVVNDVDGRVAMFEDAGYEQVRAPTEGAPLEAGDASQLGSVVRKPVGGGVEGVLMEIPKEWYEEDQAAKEARRALKETSLLSEATDLASNEGIKINRPRSGVMIE
jgi:hypothetical protein